MAEQNPSPLNGKRIVVTRAQQQSALLIELLQDRGACTAALPLVEFTEPEDFAPLDKNLNHLDKFDWLIFTSENAVAAVTVRLQLLNIPIAAVPAQQVAAVGPTTAAAVKKAGFPVTHQAHTHSGLALAKELKYSVANQSVFLPRSDRARPDLPNALKTFGAQVTEVIAYRTICPPDTTPEKLRQTIGGAADAVVFFSPSAVENFVQTIGHDFSNLPDNKSGQGIILSAVGPSTATALQEAGAQKVLVSPDTTPLSVVESLEKYFANPAAALAASKYAGARPA